jgi:argininosuccinate lyase
LTELADRLVRDHDVPFATAHRIAAQLMEACRRDPQAPLSQLLAAVSEPLHGTALRYSEPVLAEALSPRHFIQVRRTLGGPAPEEVTRATTTARAALESDQIWWHDRTGRLTQAQQRLADRCARL